jgi:hypothetical protein
MDTLPVVDKKAAKAKESGVRCADAQTDPSLPKLRNDSLGEF